MPARWRAFDAIQSEADRETRARETKGPRITPAQCEDIGHIMS